MRYLKQALVLLTPAVLVMGCGERTVSYSKDVHPLLEKYCVRCHSEGEGGEGFEKSGLRVDSYEHLMKGTRFGPVVKPGDSFTSALVMLVEGRADPSIKMPHGGGDSPSPEEIEVIKLWVDQGAKNN